jgi:hypothetical protein
MDFVNVISILEEEKGELIAHLRKLKKGHQKFTTLDSIGRKMTGDMSFAEEISMYESEIEEIKEAIRILRLSSSCSE